MAERRLRTDLAVVRAALDHVPVVGFCAAASAAQVSTRTLRRWVLLREESGGFWPTDVDIAAWREAEHRQTTTCRAWSRRSRLRSLAIADGGALVIDPTGTVRRLRALMALGWRSSDIAEYTPCSGSALGAVAVTRRPRVHVNTARHVRAAYEQLSGSPGPSQRTRTYARNRGWVAPLAWDDDTIDDPTAQPATVPADPKRSPEIDEVAVYRATHGDRVTLTTAERRAAVRVLAGRGRSERQIAEILHVTERMVARDKAAA